MIVETAYLEMYPDSKLGDYLFSISYSAKFKGYNANVKKRGNNVSFFLSKKWKEINDDVKKGLIQSLMNKLFKTKIITQNIDLYEIFLKKIHIAVPKNNLEPILVDSFNRVNTKYFFGIMEMPNLVFGKGSATRLGSYEYGTDTIRISLLFRDSPIHLLDYIMYHELLHKKHKFYSTKGKSYHHTRQFKLEEKKFENYDGMELDLNIFLRKNKIKRFFKGK